ncbi:hypothetical protein Tco_0556545 [Tanacetum coccineum]
MPQRMARLEEDVYEIRGALIEQREELPIHHIFRPICPTRGASDRGLARPAPPQLSRTYKSKPGSKFGTIVHEYDREPSRIFTQQMQEWETR